MFSTFDIILFFDDYKNFILQKNKNIKNRNIMIAQKRNII